MELEHAVEAKEQLLKFSGNIYLRRCGCAYGKVVFNSVGADCVRLSADSYIPD